MNLAKLKNYNPSNNTRKCKECSKWKDLSGFSKRKNKRRLNIQVREICKECSLKLVGKTSKYKSSEYRKNLHVKDPRTSLVYNARTRARLKGLECTITKDDIIIPEFCPLLNIPIQTNHELSENSITLDRIDSTRGYVPDNIWVISHRANTIKSNASFEELQLLVNNLGFCIKRKNCQER